MSAYDEAVDKCVEMFDRFHHAVRETNRRAEKLQAAEVEFLNAVDEQRGAYDEAMAAFRTMKDQAPTPFDVESMP